jgi:hypothetical protein
MTTAELNAYNLRRSAKKAPTFDEVTKACKIERELHEQIKAEVKRRKWQIVHHSRMDMASTCPVGSADFVILADGGRVFLIECKTGAGKLTIEQRGMILQAELLGHTVHVVRHFEAFLKIIEKGNQ